MKQEYMNYLRKNRRLSEETLRGYLHDLTAFEKWARKEAGCVTWEEVSQATIEKWVAELTARGLSAAYVKRNISSVRGLTSWAWYRGRLADNAGRYVSSPRLEKKLPVTMTMEEIASAVADTTASVATRALVCMMAETGMRIGEALAVSPRDVDKQQRVIRVHGKGAKERVVSYGDATRRLMNELYTLQGGRLFDVETERQYRYDVWMLLRRHTTATKCSPHIIRHTWACAQLQAGTDIKTLATMMGHAHVATTEIYAQTAGVKLLESFKNVRL